MLVRCRGCVSSSDPGKLTQAQPACLMQNVLVFFYFLRIFLMWTVFKVFIGFVAILLLFYVLVF